MTIHLPPDVDRLVKDCLATGFYQSEGDVIRAAMQLLRERDESIAVLKRSIESIDRGEDIPVEQAFDEIRQEMGISPDE